MSEYIKRIRTTSGDKQIDYEALANLPSINGQPLTGNVDIATGEQLVVTGNGDTASHTPAQIYAHVQAGGRAVWSSEVDGLWELASYSEVAACFTHISAEEALLYQVCIWDNGSFELFEQTYVTHAYLDSIERRLSNLENIPNANGVNF